MGVMDEKIPGGGTSVDPRHNPGFLQFVERLLSGVKGPQGAPQGGGPQNPVVSQAQQPQLPGGVPNAGLPGANLPGMARPMPGPSAGSPAQAGPASSMPMQGANIDYGRNYATKGQANAAVAGAAVENILGAVQRYKQQSFQKKMQQAQALTSEYISLSQSDDPVLQKRAQDLLQHKDAMKIFEKAHKDPNSAEYAGIVQAKDAALKTAQEKQMFDAKLQEQQQLAAAHKAEAGKYGGEQKKAEAGIPREGAERDVAMGTKPSADALTAAKAQVEAAQTRANAAAAKPRLSPPGLGPNGKWGQYVYDAENNITGWRDAPKPASMLPSSKTSIQTIDAMGRQTTQVVTQKLADRINSRTGYKGMTAPGGTPVDQASPYQKRTMIERAGWIWATMGKEPPAGPMKREVFAWMMQNSMTPGMKPSANMQQRASLAQSLLNPAPGQTMGVIDKAIAEIESRKDDMEKRGFSGRTVLSLEQLAMTLGPEYSTLAANLTTIYSVNAGVHGWRSIKAPGELAKKYGTIRMRPDSLLSNLRALKEFDQAVSDGVMHGMGGSTGTATNPMAGASSGAGASAPAGAEPQVDIDLTQVGKKKPK